MPVPVQLALHIESNQTPSSLHNTTISETLSAFSTKPHMHNLSITLISVPDEAGDLQQKSEATVREDETSHEATTL
jgi:hypothetical protein